MEWNTNLLEQNDNYGIYGIKYKDQFLYIGTYKYDWSMVKEKIENYITYPEGTSISVFHRMTPDERLNYNLISLFSTDILKLKAIKEEILYYNTLIWIKQVFILLYSPKYNNTAVSFNDAHIPCNSLDKKESKGELEIRKWLRRHNIDFSCEYIYEDLKGDYENLRFDFKIKDKPVVIEFQGEQHYRDIRAFPNASLTRKHDLLKREFCGAKGITLIEIPYNYRNLDMYLNQILYIPVDNFT